jgi:site-specific recombinase XerD
MTLLAPHLTAFLHERLAVERGASEHTCESYAHAFRLLLEFASKRLKTSPSRMELEQLDAPLILAFLEHLETARGNGASSRNVRLAAIKSFARFLEHRVPAALDQVHRLLALPSKKTESRLVGYLSREQMRALLDAPNLSTRSGIRDQAMLEVAFAAGLRVSELIGLRIDELNFQPYAVIRVHGKGRKERSLPLWKEASAALRKWLTVRGPADTPEVFLNARGQAMTRAGFKYILAKHVRTATRQCHSLKGKRVSPHVLRHSCAMNILQATRDVRKVALWLGHARVQTSEIYIRADPTEKLEAIESVVPPAMRRGRFRAPDKLLAMLKAGRPSNMRSNPPASPRGTPQRSS